MKQRGRLMLIILLILLIIAGYNLVLSPRKTASPTYQTETAQKGTLLVSVSGTGSVMGTNTASAVTSLSGVVSQIFVKNGDHVTAGQALATLDLDMASRQKYSAALASYQSAKNNLASAQNNLNTLQSAMFKANQTYMNDAIGKGRATNDPVYIEQNAEWLASEQNYKNQTNVIVQAQTAVNNAWLSLIQNSPTIYAPITGTVSALSLQKGSVLSTATTSSTSGSSSTKVANIQTQASPVVTVNLSEIDAPTVHIGDKATVTFDALPDKTFTGKVISIDTVGTQSSSVTSYPAVIQLDSVSPNILPNMSASAQIITETKDAVVLVPSAAITTQQGASTVQILKDGKPITTTVTVGASSDTQTEIVSGVAEGDTVVTGTTNTATASSPSRSGVSVFSGTGRGGFGGLGR